MFLKFIATLFILTLLSGSAFADNAQKLCTYLDYDYVPHPEQVTDQLPMRAYRITIKKNPNFVGSNGGIRQYYDVEVLNPNTDEVYSSVRMLFRCNSLGYIHCTLDVKGRDKVYDRLDIGILKNFSSGSMQNRAPYALSIPGFVFATKNSDYEDVNVLKRPLREDDLPHLLPTLWIANKQTDDCISKAE